MKELIIKIVRFCWNFFAVIGICACIIGTYSLYRTINHYDMTLSQLAAKAARKAGINSPVVTKALSPRPRFADHSFKGTIVKSHPRILYSKSMLKEVQDLYKSDKEYAKLCNNICRNKGLLWRTACWTTSSNEDAGAKAIEQLTAMVPDEPKASGNPGNGLPMALTYDLLYHHPAMTVTRHQQIELKLENMVLSHLAVLDKDSASMWHGRAQLAASAWITALGLDISRNSSLELLTRAQSHFLDALRALEITEGWPEGYNYWINNRAFPVVLACLSHINAVKAPEINNRIKRVLERLGYWHIYGARPIGGFELFGDSGPRVDLKDSAYSSYIKAKHKDQGYYNSYRWGVPLFQYKTFNDNFHIRPLKDLSMFNGKLPRRDRLIFIQTGGRMPHL